MKKENKHKYYNDGDEINFEKLNNFRKFNSNFKNNIQSNNHNIKYANSDKNYFNNILKTNQKAPIYNENDKINADTLLEGMFGQTAGIGETTISSKSNLSPTPIKDNSKNNSKSMEKKIVKVLNFDSESNNKNNNKIKVKTF